MIDVKYFDGDKAILNEFEFDDFSLVVYSEGSTKKYAVKDKTTGEYSNIFESTAISPTKPDLLEKYSYSNNERQHLVDAGTIGGFLIAIFYSFETNQFFFSRA